MYKMGIILTLPNPKVLVRIKIMGESPLQTIKLYIKEAVLVKFLHEEV